MPAAATALGFIVALACYLLGTTMLEASSATMASVAAQPAPVNTGGMILANLSALIGAAAAAAIAHDGRSIFAPLTSWVCSAAILMVVAGGSAGTPADMLALLNSR